MKKEPKEHHYFATLHYTSLHFTTLISSNVLVSKIVRQLEENIA